MRHFDSDEAVMGDAYYLMSNLCSDTDSILEKESHQDDFPCVVLAAVCLFSSDIVVSVVRDHAFPASYVTLVEAVCLG